jgi:hypothetical protein
LYDVNVVAQSRPAEARLKPHPTRNTFLVLGLWGGFGLT